MSKKKTAAKEHDRFACPHCEGLGTLPLTGVYAVTLGIARLICNERDFVVANRDAEKFACKPTALNQRLKGLEDKGFLWSERYGSQRRFYLSCRTGTLKKS